MGDSSTGSASRSAASSTHASAASARSSGLSVASVLAGVRVAKAKLAGQRHRGSAAANGATAAGTNGSGNGGGPSEAKRFHIAFHLRPQDKAVPVSALGFKKLVHDEYLCKYLERLGVTPSAPTLAAARLQLPPGELKVAAAWKSDTVTVAPLERAAVAHAARAQAAQKAKEKEARLGRRKLEQEERDGGGTTKKGKTTDSASSTTASALSSPRRRTGSLPVVAEVGGDGDAEGEPTGTAAASPKSATAHGARPGRRRLVPARSGGSVALAAQASDVVSLVLKKQEAVFEAMRSAMDHRRRMGDRDDEVDAFWRAARAKEEPETFAPTTAATEEKTADEKQDPSHTLPSLPSASASSDAPTSNPHAAQLLQVFTLYHFLHAHAFAPQSRRAAIMALEESSIAGENVLKKTNSNSTPGAGGAAGPGGASVLQVLYWRPKVEIMTAAALSARHGKRAPAPPSDTQIVDVRTSAAFGGEVAAPLSPVPDDSGFSPSSRSFSALSQLFHAPFHASAPVVAQVLRTFFDLFPRYRTGIERHWAALEAAANATPVAPWTERTHDDFLPEGQVDPAQLSMNLGGPSGADSSTAPMGAGASGGDSQPSRLQAFYNEREFRLMLGQASTLLCGPRVQQLVALLGHLLYWQTFAPMLATMRRFRVREAAAVEKGSEAESRLPRMPLELAEGDLALVRLQLQRMHVQLDHRLRGLAHYALFFLPLLLDLLATSTLNLFHSQYPMWFASAHGPSTDQTLLRSIDRLFDVHLRSAVPTSMPGSAGRHLTSESSSTSSSSAPGVPTGSSLFFHTSSLVKRAFPTPASAGARMVRKADAARDWAARLHDQQRALADRNEARREAVIQEFARAQSPEPEHHEGLHLHTKASLQEEAVLKATAEFRRAGGFSFGVRRPDGVISTHTPAVAPTALRPRPPPLPPQSARAATATTEQPSARRRTTERLPYHPPSTARVASPSGGGDTSSDGSATSRGLLFSLALRKISNRHARETTAVRSARVAAPPGLASPRAEDTPTLAMRRSRAEAERKREQQRRERSISPRRGLDED